MKSYASTLYLTPFTVFELITEHLRKCSRVLTHLPTASISWRNRLASPNCRNRSSFDPSFSAFYVNCASETVSCEMRTYAKLAFRTEVFAMCQNNFFHFASPLPLGGEPCIEILNSKSAVWSQFWTTHRRGGILKIFYQQQATQRSHGWHGKLAAFTLSDARMTSDPRRSS